MKVFVSWSGPRSKAVASGLRVLIKDVVRCSAPWVSEADIAAGARWRPAIQTELQETAFGVLCLTRDNLESPWLNFEAGALAKTVADAFVCPYLLDLKASDIPAGPLSQFQAKACTNEDTWDLIRAINAAAKAEADPESDLRRRFDRCWSDFAGLLGAVPSQPAASAKKRGANEMAEETLLLVRHLVAQSEERWSQEKHAVLAIMQDAERRKNRSLEAQLRSARGIAAVFDKGRSRYSEAAEQVMREMSVREGGESTTPHEDEGIE